MFGSEDVIIQRLLFFIPLVLSLSVHEWAHAFAAYKLGDDTAKMMGRLTLNPIVHMDPIGTVLLPLMGVPFGWAKPVPFLPSRLSKASSMKMGSMIVALAGPISNFVLVALSLGILFVSVQLNPTFATDQEALFMLLFIMILLNFILALFNLLPCPPLDGSYIADAFMPEAARPVWNKIRANGITVLILVIVIPSFMGVSFFDYPIEWIQDLVQSIALSG